LVSNPLDHWGDTGITTKVASYLTLQGATLNSYQGWVHQWPFRFLVILFSSVWMISALQLCIY
jgi:hypothetical protein